MYILYGLITVLFILNLLVIFKLQYYKNSRNQLSYFLREEINQRDTLIDSLYKDKFKQLRYEGARLDNIHLVDMNNNIISFNSLIIDSPKLVYFVWNDECKFCIENEINRFLINFRDIPQTKIIFITNLHKEIILSFKERLDINFNTYRILSVVADNDFPFNQNTLFIIEPGLELHLINIINEYSDYNYKRYYEILKARDFLE